jgi:hypothetical protein
MRKRYATRGTRLIHLESLLTYIESVAAAQQSTNSTAAHAVVEGVENKNKTAPTVTVQQIRRAAKLGRSATKQTQP